MHPGLVRRFAIGIASAESKPKGHLRAAQTDVLLRKKGRDLIGDLISGGKTRESYSQRHSPIHECAKRWRFKDGRCFMVGGREDPPPPRGGEGGQKPQLNVVAVIPSRPSQSDKIFDTLDGAPKTNARRCPRMLGYLLGRQPRKADVRPGRPVGLSTGILYPVLGIRRRASTGRLARLLSSCGFLAKRLMSFP